MAGREKGERSRRLPRVDTIPHNRIGSRFGCFNPAQASRCDHLGDFHDAVQIAAGCRRTAGLVDEKRRQLRVADTVDPIVDPQRATGQDHALAGLRLLRKLRDGAQPSVDRA